MSQTSLRRKLLIVTCCIVGIILGLLLLFVVWLNFILGGTQSNQAEKDFAPIGKHMQAIGGSKLCSSGYNGKGLDAVPPWYRVYYSVPKTPDLSNKIKSFAAEVGFELTNGVPIDRGGIVDPQTEFFIGYSDDKTLQVAVHKEASVIMYCEYGNGSRRSTDGKAIVDFRLELPDSLD